MIYLVHVQKDIIMSINNGYVDIVYMNGGIKTSDNLRESGSPFFGMMPFAQRSNVDYFFKISPFCSSQGKDWSITNWEQLVSGENGGTSNCSGRM